MDSEDEEVKNKKVEATNVQKYDAEITLAFRSDCAAFLNEFSLYKVANFEIFAGHWKLKSFISIFEKEDHLLNIHSFVEHIFFVIKQFLFDKNMFIAVGSLYMLYSLYYKQPIKEWVKLRLTLSEVDRINEIIEFYKKKNFYQPLFIYSKMQFDQALEFCIIPKPKPLDVRFINHSTLLAENFEKSPKESVIDKFKNMMENDPSLLQIEDTDKEYRDLLAKYNKVHGNVPPFPSVIGNELKMAYCKVFDLPFGDPLAGVDATESVKNIKKRAMSNMNAVYRADRSVVITNVDNSPNK